MKHNIYKSLSVILLAIGVVSCSDEPTKPDNTLPDGNIPMTFIFSHPSQSRVTETAFENGDAVGLFVAQTDRPLEISGNAINNESLTFDGSSWNSDRTLYWKKRPYNVFAYYPYQSDITSVSDLEFSVKTDQRDNASSGMSDFEASDFLYASASEVNASSDPVNLQFKHIMSKLTIRLIKGEDFEGEIPENATVYIHNVVNDATVDLSAGVATKAVRGVRKTVIARKVGPTSYSAILVPQRLENRVPLIEVEINGVSFLYESKFVFKPGIHHIVDLMVDKNPEQVKIDIGGEITNWN